MTESEAKPRTDGGDDCSLQERIRDKLLVDEPDEDALVDALDGAVSIVRGSWRIVVEDGMGEREPKDRVFTYLLAKYAASRVSDGEAPLEASIAELRDHFGHEIIREVADHGWVRTREGFLSVRPAFYQHLADEMAARYGGENNG